MLYTFKNKNGAELTAEIKEDDKTREKWIAPAMSAATNLTAEIYDNGKTITRRAFVHLETDAAGWCYFILSLKFSGIKWRACVYRV